MTAKKPPGRRSGKAGTTRDIGVIPGKVLAKELRPPCPARLGDLVPLPATKQAWNRLWSSKVAVVIDQQSDMSAVVRWAELLDERERALKKYRRKRTVAGSMGQEVLNPMFSVVMAIDKELLQLEDRFGLTPKARLQLGITYAEAGRSLEEIAHLWDEEADADDDEDPRQAADPRRGAIDTTGS